MNDSIDGMTIYNCGFIFQNATHADNFKQYVWVMTGQSSSAVGTGQFYYKIIIIER